MTALRRSVGKQLHKVILACRIWKYRLLSDCPHVQGRARVKQPVLLKGDGTIILGDRVRLGVVASPFLYSGYIYIEARKKQSMVAIGAGTMINNNCVLISEGEGVQIGADCLLGYNVQIFDSDFHELALEKRHGGSPKTGRVVIADHVFIGANVTILRSVTIGAGSVISANSVVTADIPGHVVAAGNPARVIRAL
ncbi:MAG: acyltransferase [Deltaproteobacteria bacterium]|nr:acyltransferase [Deltaproteobacteria bacterium]